MLAEIETGLVALLKASDLGQRLRQVDSLPDLEGDSLIGRFTSDAPAAYVALGSFPVVKGYARLKYGVALVARHSGSQQAARHGDSVAIGLQPMLDAALALLDGIAVPYGDDDAVAFEVVACDLISSEDLYKKGVYAGVVQIQSVAEVPLVFDLGRLADFKTFAADVDIEPPETAAEHDKWLREPPDYGTSKPELSDQLNLQE